MKMKNKIYFLLVIVSMMIISSCDKFLDPMPEARISESDMISSPVYAEGILLSAYNLLPSSYNFALDMACDDAVTNNPSSNINQIVLGGWTSSSNFESQWADSYEAFFYINKFMEIAPKVEWNGLPIRRLGFYNRLIGEAYALRGIWGFKLLQAHGGLVGEELLGYPIVTSVLTVNDNLKLPRNTYADCVKQIISDLDSAIHYLPLVWIDKPNDDIHNTTAGRKYINRINGLTAKFMKARVLLYAASPANSKSGYTMQQAAGAAAEVMVDKGGLTTAAFPVAGVEFYNLATSAEIIWSNSRKTLQRGIAEENFPPSLFGKGSTNPTQNLVNAFPNLDGTPFDKNLENTPTQYAKRDTRLAKYVIYNGSSFKGIMNFADTTSVNTPGRNVNSTLTGYYLKKFVLEKINLTPGSQVGADFFYTHARYSEALLNFAEAANESVGPNGDIRGFTARAVINALRKRGGITNTAYVDGLDQAGMRTLIKNERRIELCFEGHRFWDIRRWMDVPTMKTSAYGIRFAPDNTSATVSEIQKRLFEDYQIYGCVPYIERLKYDIKQNNEWQ